MQVYVQPHPGLGDLAGEHTDDDDDEQAGGGDELQEVWYDAQEPLGGEEDVLDGLEVLDAHEDGANGWTSGEDASSDGLAHEEDDVVRPKKGTGRWYRRLRMDSVVQGNPFSVLQTCFWIAQMKYDFRISDAAIDAFCSLIHYLLLPAGNLFPPSYHLVKAVLGVPDGIQCVRHVCQQCWRLFPDMQPEQYQHHSGDKCAHCSADRFNIGVGGVPTPVRCAYYFGNEDSVLDLVSKPGVIESILDYRIEAWKQPWTFWGSPAGRALDRACRYKFSKPPPGEVAIMFSLGKLCHTAYYASTSLP